MTQRSKPTSTGSIKGWTILLVDDTPDNLTVAKTALRFHGAQVYTATDGVEGLELLKTIQPTVILLDIRMPNMDGWTMFKFIRENPALAHVPVIAITAYAMDTDREEIMNEGFDGYISKPFDIFVFISQIQDFVTQAIQKHQKSEDASV